MANGGNAELVFAPLGGVGEIGMNFALYGFGPANKREWLIVDVGVTFPDDKLPGVDLVLPDIRFIEDKLADLRGIVITHAHEDHYGALHDLWPRLKAPVWMTPFTAGLLEAKRQSEAGAPQIPVTIFKAGEKFTVGPFAIEAIPVAHSIPEPMALAITTAAGTVIHTGDWRIDLAPEIGPPTDEARLRQLGDAGVLALICDSTNAMREGESPSEQAVGEGLVGRHARIREVLVQHQGGPHAPRRQPAEVRGGVAVDVEHARAAGSSEGDQVGEDARIEAAAAEMGDRDAVLGQPTGGLLGCLEADERHREARGVVAREPPGEQP